MILPLQELYLVFNYLEKAEDMANSEDANLYSTEFAFTDLIGKVKDILV